MTWICGKLCSSCSHRHNGIFFLTFCCWIAEIWLFSYLLCFCFFQMFGRSPMIFAHLAVSLLTPLPLHVRVRIHWTTTAVYLVCRSVTKPTRAYATRATSCCLWTDSTCVRPSLLSVFISSALPQAISVVAGQRGNAPTVWSSQAGQDYPRHHQRQADIPAPDPPHTAPFLQCR